MKTRFIAAALVVSLTAPVIVPPRVACAQSADDASTKLARQRFQEGVAFFDKGQYELARASFLQAYALRKHPAVLLNLAQSSLKSGHTVEAARYFQQFLREHSSATAAQRTDAERGLREARARLGRIEIIGAPSGAEIFVDEDRVGVAPLDPIDVEPGTHNVKARSRTDEVVQVTAGGGQLVAARFGAAAAAPPPVTPLPAPPVATAPPPAAPVDTPAPAVETPPEEPAVPPQPTMATSEGSHGVMPNNMVPLVVGGVLALGGFGTAIGMAVAKGSAQSSADSVAEAIRQAGGVTGQCLASAPNYARFANACKALSDDNSKVNTDAMVANIGLGVGIGMTVLTGVYWFLSSKTPNDSASTTGDTRPILTPIIGRGVGGLELGARF